MEPAMCCFVSFVTFCVLVSAASMLGYYGSAEVAVGPGCSRLLQASSLFVKDVEVSLEGGPQVSNSSGLVLYGMAGAPTLDVAAEWSEARRVGVPANVHREWVYFLNKGARIEAAYSVESDADVPYPLCIVIAQGKEGFIRWVEDPTEHNTAVSWHLVQGNGTIEQTIDHSSEYYIVVHNLNSHQDTAVQLNFSIRALIYNTTGAEYRCSLGQQRVCTYSLPFLKDNVAVLSSGFKEGLDSDEQRVRLSYEPRWIVYVVGSAILAIVLMLLYETVRMLCDPSSGAGRGSVEPRTPLLTDKDDDDDASLGSSYDSVSNDGDDAEGSGKGGGSGCVVCCDARKDCFFIPCGHSATCYACGARIVEEHGSCPFCRRRLKKVRRIFAV